MENKSTKTKHTICDFYNIQHKIAEYTNTEQYQELLCKLIYCNINNGINSEENYNKMIYVQKIIYKHTKNIPEFKILYKLASATILSINSKYGIAILFSYHYLPYFHYCLQTYFLEGKNAFTENCDSYIQCYNILRPKKQIQSNKN